MAGPENMMMDCFSRGYEKNVKNPMKKSRVSTEGKVSPRRREMAHQTRTAIFSWCENWHFCEQTALLQSSGSRRFDFGLMK
eukprot:scaffold5918_cov130-Cylindrotheca_fusiformis.AAC.2